MNFVLRFADVMRCVYIYSSPSVMERGVVDYQCATASLVTYILQNCEAGITSHSNE